MGLWENLDGHNRHVIQTRLQLVDRRSDLARIEVAAFFDLGFYQ